MSQKQINHNNEYKNISEIKISVDTNIVLDNKDNNYYEKQNYNKNYNIDVDVINSRNSCYLKNISLDK